MGRKEKAAKPIAQDRLFPKHPRLFKRERLRVRIKLRPKQRPILCPRPYKPIIAGCEHQRLRQRTRGAFLVRRQQGFREKRPTARGGGLLHQSMDQEWSLAGR